MSAADNPHSASPFFQVCAASAPGCGRVLALPPGRVAVDPFREGRGVLALEEEQQVGQVALGIDGQDGHAAAQGLLDEDDGLAGLARSGHAHDQTVRQQIGGIEDDRRPERARSGIELLAEVEPVFHGPEYIESRRGFSLSFPGDTRRRSRVSQPTPFEALTLGPRDGTGVALNGTGVPREVGTGWREQ